jgi:DNA-directed RNA polymerase subunit H
LAEQSTPSHELIPKHKILHKEDGEKILSQFKSSRLQIPKIKAKDAALIDANVKAGQIIEITRLDGSLYYRLVIG